MTTTNSTGFLSLEAAEAITMGQRIVLDSSGKAAVADATAAGIGVALQATALAGTVTVKLFTGPGTFQMVAAGAITRGAGLYAIAAGKVDDAGVKTIPFVAKEAATASGDIIECVFQPFVV